MKKLLKRKLFNDGGLTKNFFLWEIVGQSGIIYEIIEEFRGKRIARAMLRGIYRDRIKAMTEFRNVVQAEVASRRTPTFGHKLVFS